MPSNGYFDSKHDISIETIGGFWCHGCSVGKTAMEQSPDLRYCQGCYGFLLTEVEALSKTSRLAWIPRVTAKSKSGTHQNTKLDTSSSVDIESPLEKEKGVLVRTKTNPPHEYQNPAQTPTQPKPASIIRR